MKLQKLSRLPKRLSQDLRIIRLAKNWRELLSAKAANRPFTRIELRSGIVMNSPREVALNFLFHEIWLDEFYAPKGYEIRANDTVVDIGGNIGVFALWAATRAENVRVKSYEPFPKNAEYFAANLKASGLSNVELHAAAVADAEGARTLHLEDSWMMHSLTQKSSVEKGVEVECVSLDTVVEDIERCDLLKLDCEGGEYEILYGASDKSLHKISRIVCEFDERDAVRRNASGLSEFLSTNGFVLDEIRELRPGLGFICARRAVPNRRKRGSFFRKK